MCVLAAASNIGNERPAVRQSSFGGQGSPSGQGWFLTTAVMPLQGFLELITKNATPYGLVVTLVRDDLLD